MGGYGSGRPSHKTKAEECRSLDVNRMHRASCFVEGETASWVWSRDGKEVARIGYQMTESGLMLDYRVRIRGGGWEPIKQLVLIEFVNCNYGGQRPYFRCPGAVAGRSCNRRVGKLYADGRYFLCRHCYDITHTCQTEPRHERLLRRANKIRVALGGEPGAAHWIAFKPKGMWQRTYQRKRFEIEWCEHQANRVFIERYRSLLNSEDVKFVLST